jgi:uncharacterized C2H2 Zn-finger protein
MSMSPNQTNHICEKCNRNFKSKQGLVRHKTRIVPCDEPIDLSCPICSKIFKSKFNLDRHKNKKNPCEKNIPKQITRTVEDELKILDKETEKEILLLETKHSQHKELISLQKQKHLEIESLKTARKEKTAHVINNIQNNIHIDKLINYHVTQNTVNVVCATEENLNLPLQRFQTLLEKNEAIQMVYPNGNNTNLPVELISKLHGKEAHPKYRNLWYNSELDGFYRINNKQWEYIKEEEELTKQIRTSLHNALKILHESVGNYTNYNDDNYYGNYGRFQGYMKEKDESYYRDIGTRGLKS